MTEPAADPRSHRARADRLRRSRQRRRARPCRSPAASAVTGQTLLVPGDFSSAAFWMVAAAALPGLARRDRGCRPEPDAHRAPRRPAPLRRACRRRRPTRHDGRRAARHGRGRRRPRPEPIDDRAGGSARADRRAAGHRGARRARRRGHGARRRASCASRKATASRRWSPASARSASRPTSARTASSIRGHAAAPARRRRRRARRSPDGDGVCDRGARRRGPSRIDGADAVAISYPGFFETLRAGSSR